ncbi:MAG: L-threonylcarbamoyladenylate synthase [Candidatus Binataceae bacterium]
MTEETGSAFLVDAAGASASEFERAIAALRSGNVIAYPTETFYGLGVDPFLKGSLERLFAIKAREPEKPVALIAADSAMAFELACQLPMAARRLAEAFWPGPLTLVLPARADLPAALIGPDGGVGVRVSSHPTARALAAALKRPITATSANLSGKAPAMTVTAAQAAFHSKVKVFLEGGRMTAAAPSTIVGFHAGRLRVLRVGAIAEHELLAALGGSR